MIISDTGRKLTKNVQPR